MNSVGMIFFAIATATIITALTLKDRRTPEVIKALTSGGAELIDASLGG